MKRLWGVVLAWLGTIILYAFTSGWWALMFLVLSMSGSEEDFTAPVALYLCGWPVATSLTLVAVVATVIVRRSERKQLIVSLAVTPYLLWLLSALPFLIYQYFFLE